MGHAVAEPHPRHPVDLREGPHDDHVRAIFDPLERRPVRGIFDQLEVRLVHDEEDRLGRVLDPAVDLGAGGQRAGRVVGVAEVDDRPVPVLLDHLTHAADVVRISEVQRHPDQVVGKRLLIVRHVLEGRVGHDQGHPGRGERLDGHLQDLRGAGSQQQVFRLHAARLGEQRHEVRRPLARVAVPVLDIVDHRLACRFGQPQRILVGEQAERTVGGEMRSPASRQIALERGGWARSCCCRKGSRGSRTKKDSAIHRCPPGSKCPSAVVERAGQGDYRTPVSSPCASARGVRSPLAW